LHDAIFTDVVVLVKYHAGGIWKRNFISTVRPSVHTNLSQKRSFWKLDTLQTEGIWKRQLCVLVWTENIWKRKLFGNDDVTIMLIMMLPVSCVKNCLVSVFGCKLNKTLYLENREEQIQIKLFENHFHVWFGVWWKPPCIKGYLCQ